MLFFWLSARITVHSLLLPCKRAVYGTHSCWLTLTLSFSSSRSYYGTDFLQLSHIADTFPTTSSTWTGLSLWRWRQYVPPKRRKTHLPQDIETQKKVNRSTVAFKVCERIMFKCGWFDGLCRASAIVRTTIQDCQHRTADPRLATAGKP
jgi:hypothetical protein